MSDRQIEKAKAFLLLHHGPDTLVLPNAWDVVSARIFEQASFRAIGTTSYAIAASLGYLDGERIPFAEMIAAIERIAKNTDLPVNADIEAGYGKGITEELIKRMIERAKAISQRPGHWWSDQLNNRDAVRGYHPLGEEIWTQTKGKIDAFVHAVGTAHSIHGAMEALSAHKRGIHVVAVEPEESAVLSGRAPGSHNIEGIGIGFVPPLWEGDRVQEIMTVSTQEAKAMTRRLAREEGIFTGTSSGANVVAALRVAGQLGSKGNVVTLIVDSGQRYMSTDLFR